jgi:hypothetical protein
MPPILSCRDISIYLDASGNASIAPSDVYASGEDNCGNVTPVSVSPSAFDCSDVGVNLVTLTAEDGHGNFATGQAAVTVLHRDPPSMLQLDVSRSQASESCCKPEGLGVPCATEIVVHADVAASCCLVFQPTELRASVLAGSALLGNVEISTEERGSHIAVTGRIPLVYPDGCPTPTLIDVSFGGESCTSGFAATVGSWGATPLPRLIAANSTSLRWWPEITTPIPQDAGPWDELNRHSPYTLQFRFEDPAGNLVAPTPRLLAALAKLNDAGEMTTLDVQQPVSFDAESRAYSLSLDPDRLGLDPGRYVVWLEGFPKASLLMLFVVAE